MTAAILVAGEALIDLVIAPDGRVAAALGGAPFNAARAGSRMGGDVAFVGALSRDRFGTMLAAQLIADGVDLADAVRVESPTTLAAAELDPDGAATYRFYIDGTSAPALTSFPAAAPSAFLTGGLALVLEPMATTVTRAVERLAATSVVMVDVNCRPALIADRDAYVRRVDAVLAGASVVKVSTEDLEYLARDVDPLESARRILDRGSSVVLVTDGGRPLRLLAATSAGIAERTVAVPPVDVVDTIGAGDTFAGTFLAELVGSGLGRDHLGDLDTLRPVVDTAVRAAAIACQRAGADPPWRHELP